jgi:hypothetical protein
MYNTPCAYYQRAKRISDDLLLALRTGCMKDEGYIIQAIAFEIKDCVYCVAIDPWRKIKQSDRSCDAWFHEDDFELKPFAS